MLEAGCDWSRDWSHDCWWASHKIRWWLVTWLNTDCWLASLGRKEFTSILGREFWPCKGLVCTRLATLAMCYNKQYLSSSKKQTNQKHFSALKRTNKQRRSIHTPEISSLSASYFRPLHFLRRWSNFLRILQIFLHQLVSPGCQIIFGYFHILLLELLQSRERQKIIIIDQPLALCT